MPETPVKKISALFISVFLATAMVAGILWTLFAFWGSAPVPIAYVIREIQPNNGPFVEVCDAPDITVVENTVTKKLEYKCGNLGNLNEVLYE